jgi:cathepsin C
VTDYYFLGGSYGKCNEYHIMKELYERGPVVISFEPDYTFMMYKGGVYNSVKKSWIDKGVSSKPEWQKVDHSVTAVGWGYDEEKKVKYWLLQNSWGEHWGENGYFKMLRGKDHLGIESICEGGNIKPIKKSQ